MMVEDIAGVVVRGSRAIRSSKLQGREAEARLIRDTNSACTQMKAQDLLVLISVDFEYR